MTNEKKEVFCVGNSEQKGGMDGEGKKEKKVNLAGRNVGNVP